MKSNNLRGQIVVESAEVTSEEIIELYRILERWHVMTKREFRCIRRSCWKRNWRDWETTTVGRWRIPESVHHRWSTITRIMVSGTIKLSIGYSWKSTCWSSGKAFAIWKYWKFTWKICGGSIGVFPHFFLINFWFKLQIRFIDKIPESIQNYFQYRSLKKCAADWKSLKQSIAMTQKKKNSYSFSSLMIESFVLYGNP